MLPVSIGMAGKHETPTAGALLQESLATSDDVAVTGGLHRQMRHYGMNPRRE